MSNRKGTDMIEHQTDKSMFWCHSFGIGGGLSWAAAAFHQYGTALTTVPPLVFAGISLWSAIRAARSSRLDEGRKQRAEAREVELHHARLARLRAGLPLPADPEPAAV